MLSLYLCTCCTDGWEGKDDEPTVDPYRTYYN